MARKSLSSKHPYRDRQDTRPTRQTGNINVQNNNTNNDEPTGNEPNVRSDNNTGIGDASVNNEKLTKHTSNHSGDA